MGGKKSKKSKKEAPAPQEEEVDWNEGAKKVSKKQLEKQQRQEEQALKKKQKDELKKQEDEANSKIKKKTKKQPRKNNQSSAIDDALNQSQSISAEGLDDAIAAMTLLKKDAVGANEIDRHPERRFKAALASFTERRLPDLRNENPGLRKKQLEELAYKEFQKSDENPFNKETNVSYNASEQDVENVKHSVKQKRAKRYER